MGEDDLLDLVTNYTNSQFEYVTSNTFLENRWREVSSIKSFVENNTYGNLHISIELDVNEISRLRFHTQNNLASSN